MTTQQEVSKFLSDFKTKMKIFDIYFRDERGKNAQALLLLEITPAKRKEILLELKSTDYSAGPKDDRLYGSASLWTFGKTVKEKLVYIKISMEKPIAERSAFLFILPNEACRFLLKRKSLNNKN